MTTPRSGFLIVAASAIVLLVTGMARAEVSSPPNIQGTAQDDGVTIRGEARQRGRNPHGTPDPVDYQEKWAFVCPQRDNTYRDGFADCDTPGPEAELCEDGSPRVTLWRRTPSVGTTDGWSLWQDTGHNACLSAGPPSLTLTDFRALPLAPSPVHVQPPHGWTFVNIDTIVHTSDAPQYLRTTLLGYTVEVRATPVQFTWDFGDGTTVTTTDPGAPWPDHAIAHAYRSEAIHTISLTTHWRGHYRLTDTTTWHPVTGTATTTSTSGPLTVHTARARLVHEPT